MGLSNKPPSVVEAKTLCESAKKLKTKINSFLVNVYLRSDQFTSKAYLKLMKKYIFSEGEQFPLMSYHNNGSAHLVQLVYAGGECYVACSRESQSVQLLQPVRTCIY